MSLRTDLKVSLRPNVLLARYTTMQVGGEALYFAEPTCEDELLEAIEFARQEKISFMVLGKGSNVIFPDAGYPGLVITLIHFQDNRIEFDPENPRVTVSSGVHLYRFALACRNAGLGGAEFLANIPGTLGGAVVMNAGFSRFPGQLNEIGDLVEEVTVLSEDGSKERLARKDLAFSYRHSNLEGRIVLEAKLLLWRRKPEEIEKEIRANFDYRNRKQDLLHPSSGSIFKNPKAPNPSAGQLIEKLGLKGTRVGSAMVSEKHGNYIINCGQAKSSDVIELIEKIQKTVLDATEVFLEREVRIIEKP